MTETEYEIRDAEDNLFCKMQRTEDGVFLKTPTSKITFANLSNQVANPRKASRGKGRHSSKRAK